MTGIPIEPAGPAGLEVFESRAVDLTPDDATDEMRARIAQVAEHAYRHTERQWSRRQAEAGVAAFDWVGKNPGRSFLAIPAGIRDWLAPDQWRGLEAFLIDGRLRTDRDLFERLDRQMVYEPDRFAAVDLDRHRLSLDDEDHARFVGGQKAIVEGRVDPGHVRHDWLRRGIDRALTVLRIDTDGAEAVDARADARDQLDSFETIEGRAPNGQDIDGIVAEVIDRSFGEDSPVPSASDGVIDPWNIILAANPPGAGGRGSGQGSPPRLPAAPGQRPTPGPNRLPQEVPPGLPSLIENWRRWRQPPATSPPPDTAGPRSAAEHDAGSPAEIPKREELQKPSRSKEFLPEEGTWAPSQPWPANHGFDGETRMETLEPGTKVDRYGNPTGRYLSPQGTPFEQRSLPEQAKERPLNVYEVVKPFEVQAGRIAPYDNQPGGGTQYYLDGRTVEDLIDSGHLRKLQ